jgi:predicted transcriptional regulator
MELREKFEKFRRSKSINKELLASWSKIHRNTIWRFETGKHDIKLSSFNKMVDELGGEIIIIDKR